MSKQNVISTRISDDVLAMIDRLAAAEDRSRSWVLAKLVESSARKEVELADFIQKGIDDIERGDFYTQQEMEAWFATKKANRAGRIVAE